MTASEIHPGDAVKIEVHVDGHVYEQKGTVVSVKPTWAVIDVGGRTVTAYTSQLRRDK